MPNATIRTYANYKINGVNFEVSKIISEDSHVQNIVKEVSFLEKFSKKKSLRIKDMESGLEK